MNVQPSHEGAGGLVYATRIAARLDAEERRAGALQTRGLAVVSTSGAIVSLLLAVGPSVWRGPSPAWWPVRLLIALGAAAFVAAVAGGLTVNWPLARWQPDSRDLTKRVAPENWANHTATQAAKALAVGDGVRLQEAEETNKELVKRLRASLAAEAMAIALMVAAVITALVHG